MKIITKTKQATLLLLAFFLLQGAQAQDDLEVYIKRLKTSAATGGKETAFLSAGADFISGQEYFESKEFVMAAMYFKKCVDKEPQNAFFNYQYAISLINQKDQYKTAHAQAYLQKAFTLSPDLKKRFEQAYATKPAQAIPAAQPAPVASNATTPAADDLDAYIKRLKTSDAARGKETAFLSAGADFISGQAYLESKQYGLAAMYFKNSVEKEPGNPYFNYQYAIALMNQGDEYKTEFALPYLQKAFVLNPNLKTRFEQKNGFLPGTATTPAPPQKNTKAATPVKGPASAPPAAALPTNALKGLDKYIGGLKYSQSTGGAETAMNTVGRNVLYGYENYEAAQYISAATDFRLALSADKEHPYINYLLGVSLYAQGKSSEAEPFLQKAFAADPSLKQRFATDGPDAATRHQRLEDAKKVKTTPATKPVYGGKLVFGDYHCTVLVWNGPNASPAYRHDPKGYFELKANGTYRWLDDGATGGYSYDAKTGNLKWLSGHFAAAPPKVSLYQQGTTVAQITLEFSDNYRWQCGCNK
jgi:tetratricopeptide (TPR) repeat protein